MNIFWTMGDMKTLYIWKKFRRFQTFRWKNFSDRKNSSRRTPRLWRPNVKFHFLTIFRKSSGCKKVRHSNVPEMFLERDMIFFSPKNHQELIPKNSSSKFRPSNWQKSRKMSKMMKIRILINSDVEVVAHSEVVQNTSKTPKLSISDHISLLKSELPLKNSSRKIAFSPFLWILGDVISSSGMSS